LRPARWELRKPHPPSRGETTRERTKQVGELTPIASNGPRLGGSTHGYTSWRCTERKGMPNTCAWRRRGRLEYCRCRLKLTPCTLADFTKKPCRNIHAPARLRGLVPASLLARPHGIAQQPGGKKSPISRRQHLRGPKGYTRRCSGAVVGDSHNGPLNNQGEPTFFRKNKTQTNLKDA
jgi:hypothetical protein